MKTASVFFTVMTLLLVGCVNASDFFKSLDCDEVKSFGGFGSQAMLSVSRISPSKTPLGPDDKESLVQSSTLVNLRILDLSNQDVDDGFVKTLSENPTFARLIILDLSGNSNVTDKAMESLLESPYIGSIRDLPQVSGRYGCSSSVVYVRTHGTGVKKRHQDPLFWFSVSYRHPITGIETDERSDEAIKLLEITM